MTHYFISITVGICEIIITVLYCWKLRHVFFCDEKCTNSNVNEKCNIESEDNSKHIKSYSFIQSIILIILISIVFILSSIYLINATENIFGFIKLSVVLMAVVIAAIIDFNQRIIPNMVILVGVAIRAIIYVFEIIFCNSEILEIAKNDLIGLAIGFGVLFVAHIISKPSIGMGDVKLFGLIGICTGGICTYSTLLISLIINTILSVVLMIVKKKGKKDSIPFAPAICVGYIASLFIASF